MEKDMKRKKKAGEKNNISMEVLASVSHEIRNPVNVVIGLIHLLKSAETEEEKERYINELIKTSQGLLELVNNIMDFSKVRAGKLNYDFKSANLRAYIEENLMGFKTVAEAKGLDLILDIDPSLPERLYTDPVKVNQVLLNLISNSLKFTSQGYVKLLVETEEIGHDAVTVKFEVQDTGIGIPNEKLKKIFNAFDQGSDEINLKFGGTGLGLSICKKVVSKLGGELKVQSEVEVGSRFFFRLNFPLPKAEQPAISEEAEPKKILTNKIRTVLVVDDSELNTLLIKKTLEKENFCVLIAHNGLAAIKILQEKSVDLVLLDIHMPGMNGIEAAGIIRNLPGLSDLPIIAVTGSTDIASLKNSGSWFSDHILKPFHPEGLAQRVTAALCSNEVG
jgi:CheY-like chemotaxis protein/nitrogen-specific signal transduction histidine kinase